MVAGGGPDFLLDSEESFNHMRFSSLVETCFVHAPLRITTCTITADTMKIFVNNKGRDM